MRVVTGSRVQGVPCNKCWGGVEQLGAHHHGNNNYTVSVRETILVYLLYSLCLSLYLYLLHTVTMETIFSTPSLSLSYPSNSSTGRSLWEWWCVIVYYLTCYQVSCFNYTSSPLEGKSRKKASQKVLEIYCSFRFFVLTSLLKHLIFIISPPCSRELLAQTRIGFT